MRVPYAFKEAFTEPLNLAFLILAAIIGVASRGEAAALVMLALVGEAAYMIFVPDSGWYRGVLRDRHARARRLERAKMKRELLPGLLPQDRNRFLRLENMRNQLPAASAIGFGKDAMGDVCEQMDVLLDKFLHFAAKGAQYRAYLVDMVRPAAGPPSTGNAWADRLFDVANRFLAEKQEAVTIPVNGGPPRRINDYTELIGEIQKGLDARIEQTKLSLQTQTHDANRQVVAKNLEIVQKRRERIGELGNIITNLECQLDLIQNTFELISDQVRTLPPEQVLHDINEVVLQTESTTQMLAASAPLEFQLNRLDRTLA